MVFFREGNRPLLVDSFLSRKTLHVGSDAAASGIRSRIDVSYILSDSLSLS